MGLNIDAKKAVELSGYSGQFKRSLYDTIRWSSKSDKINDIDELAYLLATASVESGYSLQRWESDYLCGQTGVPYVGQPCKLALDYYRSTDGKQNYYNLGVDKNGLPYFGRGLIQLTGKSNYKSIGDKIGVDLVNNPDKALQPDISLKVAIEYMHSRGTFDAAKNHDFYKARKTVGKSGSDWQLIGERHKKWVEILEASKKNNSIISIFTGKKDTDGSSNVMPALFSGLAVVGVALAVTYFIRRRRR